MDLANPPFERGEVFTQYDDDQTIDATAGAHYEGMEFRFDDKDYAGASGGVVPDRTGLDVICRIVRNNSGTTLLGKRFLKNKVDGTTPALNVGQTGGYATAVTDPILGVSDEFLPAAGVPDGALFWAVVQGPTIVTTDGSGDTNIPVGAGVIPATNGTAVQSAADTNAQVPAFCTVAVNATAANCNIKLKGARL